MIARSASQTSKSSNEVPVPDQRGGGAISWDWVFKEVGPDLVRFVVVAVDSGGPASVGMVHRFDRRSFGRSVVTSFLILLPEVESLCVDESIFLKCRE